MYIIRGYFAELIEMWIDNPTMDNEQNIKTKISFRLDSSMVCCNLENLHLWRKPCKESILTTSWKCDKNQINVFLPYEHKWDLYSSSQSVLSFQCEARFFLYCVLWIAVVQFRSPICNPWYWRNVVGIPEKNQAIILATCKLKSFYLLVVLSLGWCKIHYKTDKLIDDFRPKKRLVAKFQVHTVSSEKGWTARTGNTESPSR